MYVPSPTSRTGKRVYLSLWDLFWALISPIIALYVRDVEILLQPDWTVMAYYWVLSSGFALVAFFALRLQDGMTRYFSVHEALDIAEAVLLAQLMTCAAFFTLTRLDGIPRSMPLIHGGDLGCWTDCSAAVRAHCVQCRRRIGELPFSPRAYHPDRGKSICLYIYPIAENLWSRSACRRGAR